MYEYLNTAVMNTNCNHKSPFKAQTLLYAPPVLTFNKFTFFPDSVFIQCWPRRNKQLISSCTALHAQFL